VDRIGDLLERPGALEPRADAILAPGRRPLTHGELGELVSGVAGGLRANGLTEGSRVALLVENGPEAACAFLALSRAAAVAPLNPSYRAQELGFYLEDIHADAIVVDATLDTPAREVARELGIGVLELTADPAAPAGVFGIDGVVPAAPFDDRPDPDAVALLLHTSGTTARPKLVRSPTAAGRERDERRADARPDALGPLPET
jgi:acyl-CoA synthetase (AMP-forming)/AMP-acid ligase II